MLALCRQPLVHAIDSGASRSQRYVAQWRGSAYQIAQASEEGWMLRRSRYRSTTTTTLQSGALIDRRPARAMSPGVPAVLMRGGTSKGVFLQARDLPPPGPRRDALVLDLMGSPDPMQIDGLGGTYSSTSKVMIVEPGPDSTVPLLVRSGRRRHTDGRLVGQLRQPDDGGRGLRGRGGTGPGGRTADSRPPAQRQYRGADRRRSPGREWSGADARHPAGRRGAPPGRTDRHPTTTIRRLGHGPAPPYRSRRPMCSTCPTGP